MILGKSPCTSISLDPLGEIERSEIMTYEEQEAAELSSKAKGKKRKSEDVENEEIVHHENDEMEGLVNDDINDTEEAEDEGTAVNLGPRNETAPARKRSKFPHMIRTCENITPEAMFKVLEFGRGFLIAKYDEMKVCLLFS